LKYKQNKTKKQIRNRNKQETTAKGAAYSEMQVTSSN
jgi:hypothetical protein